MSKIIGKFPLQVTDEQVIKMPKDAEILSVQNQFEKICIWAKIDPEAKKVDRNIQIRGTGHDATDTGKFLGTVQMSNGELVFHVFEK